MVNGKSMNTCLGDLYSVNWMEDSDSKTGLGSRLGDQFVKVKKETNKSHTMEYGTQSWKWGDLVSDFQTSDLDKATATATATAKATTDVPKDAVDSRDIELLLAFYKYLRTAPSDPADRTAAAKALLTQVQHREESDKIYASVFSSVQASRELEAVSVEEKVSCERAVIDAAEEHCGAFSDYSLKFTAPLIALCKSHSVSDMVASLKSTCN